MKLTLNQRRFLIVWILFHSFALFVNLTGIRGEIDSGESTFYFFTSGESSGFWPFTSYYYEEPQTIKTKSLSSFLDSANSNTKTKKVEPKYKIGIHSQTGKKVRIPTGLVESVNFFNNPKNKDVNVIPTDSTVTDFRPIVQEVVGIAHSYFGGIFNSYGFAEYVLYICLGVCAVFLPKLWKDPTP
jgi:hypothetical protein